jgi:hypothetical protein
MEGMAGVSHAGAGTTVSRNALGGAERQRGRPSGWGKPPRGPRESRTRAGPGNIEPDFRRASVRHKGSPHAATHEQGSNPQVFGETTAEFVRRQRLEFAQELLRSSELQVQQIARRAGYAHHGSFTAAFTRQFGHSPKKVSRAITSDPGT